MPDPEARARSGSGPNGAAAVPSQAAPVEPRDLRGFLFLALQLALLIVVIRRFQLEQPAFLHLMLLAAGGFLVHYFLPLAYRLPFFLLLSLSGIAVVLGIGLGFWLVAIGLGLVGICHLPLSFRSRVALLLAVALALAALRAGLVPAPFAVGMWPVLGSMFMFRLIVYLYDLRHQAAPTGVWRSLSYFFLLPNPCFPLFPVVDYQTFCRTYYDADRQLIHQNGLRGIWRGVCHLLLYRLVYYWISLSPTQVADLGDLIRYLLSAYLLYLRISGHFHIIAGVLHLFGFNLPLTNNRYFLASSFTEFWRRINIYWKDFMMKVFWYPAYFKLRGGGVRQALLWSTLLVFVVTWALHAYQWFWIRGSYLFSWNDALTWLMFGLLVTANELYENAYGRRRAAARKTVRLLTIEVLKTLSTFSVICLIWSFWSSESVAAWLSVMRAGARLSFGDPRLPPAFIAGLLVFIAVIVIQARRPTAGLGVRSRGELAASRAFLIGGVLALNLLLTPDLYARYLIGSRIEVVAEIASSLRESRLSGRDVDLLERGYYEQLLGLHHFNSELWELYAQWPHDWARLEDTEVWRKTEGLLRHDLAPLTEVRLRNARLTTNRWGMRDRDYPLHPAPGVFRIALLGSSHAMGFGVDDGQTFEAVLEERLNRDRATARYSAYEILNFSVEAYHPIQQLVVLEDRALEFRPAMMILVAHTGSASHAVNSLVDAYREGVPLRYDFLERLLRERGIDTATGRSEALRRLDEDRFELLQWVYQRMADLSRSHGVQPVWVHLPTAGQAAAEGDLERLIALAHRAGFVTLDLTGCFDGHGVEEIWFGEWDRHPNALGHRLIAERLYQLLMDRESDLALDRSPAPPSGP